MNPDHNTLTTLPACYHQKGSTLTIDLLKPFISSDLNQQKVSHLKLISGNEAGISLSVDGCQLILDLCAYQTGNTQLHYSYRISQQDKHYSQHTIVVVLSPSENDFATLIEATVTSDHPVASLSQEENNPQASSIDNELFEIDQLLTDIDGESDEFKHVSEEGTVTSTVASNECMTGSNNAVDNNCENTLHNDAERTPEHAKAQDDHAPVEDENKPSTLPLTEKNPEEGIHITTENEESTVPAFDEASFSDCSHQSAGDASPMEASENKRHLALEAAEVNTSTEEFHFSTTPITSDSGDSTFSFENASSDSEQDTMEETVSYEDLTPAPESHDKNSFDDILNEVEQAISKADQLLDATLAIHPSTESPDDAAEKALEEIIGQMSEPWQQDAATELEALINSLPEEKPNLDQPDPGASALFHQSMHKLTTAIPQTLTINSHESYTFSLEDFSSVQHASAKSIEAVQLIALPISGHLIYNNQPAETEQIISKRDLLTGRLKFAPDDDVSTNRPVSFRYILCGDSQH